MTVPLNMLLTRIEKSFTNISRAGILVRSDVPFFLSDVLHYFILNNVS